MQKPLPMKEKFEIILLQEVSEFLDSLDSKTREKIIYNLRKSQFISDVDLFKKLKDEIWEFRTFYNKKYIRLFSFWDKTEKSNTIVVSTHGIIKKSGKTPLLEIEKAENIRLKYLAEKNK